MELKHIIGQNLYSFRESGGYSQLQVAEFLGVDRSLIAHYEAGRREVSFVHLKKISDLFNIEVEDLMEMDGYKNTVNHAFVFRNEGLDTVGLQAIAKFQKVVKNYLKMKKMVSEEG